MQLATTIHAGRQRSQLGPTEGSLPRRIVRAAGRLGSVPGRLRCEHWAAAMGGVKYAAELLDDGRRAKAGKVLAAAIKIIDERKF